MDIIILHSPLDGASRNLMQALGGEPSGPDVTISMEGRSVRIIPDHALAVAVCPNFSAYPALVVKDGETLRVKSPVGSWAECAAFVETPAQPPLEAAKPPLSKLEFLRLFTDEELVRLKTLEASDPVVAVIWEQVRAAENVRLDDERTVRGAEYLASKGYIAPERKSAILAG
jgi:hypothetical protein